MNNTDQKTFYTNIWHTKKLEQYYPKKRPNCVCVPSCRPWVNNVLLGPNEQVYVIGNLGLYLFSGIGHCAKIISRTEIKTTPRANYLGFWKRHRYKVWEMPYHLPNTLLRLSEVKINVVTNYSQWDKWEGRPPAGRSGRGVTGEPGPGGCSPLSSRCVQLHLLQGAGNSYPVLINRHILRGRTNAKITIDKTRQWIHPWTMTSWFLGLQMISQ